MSMKTKTIINCYGNLPCLFRQFFTLHFLRPYAAASSSTNDNNNNNNKNEECYYYDDDDDDDDDDDLGVNEALGLFDPLMGKRPMPSIRAFNHLLGALSKKDRCSTVVFSMYKQMMGCLHFRPNVRTMNTVIKCLCLLKKVDLSFPVLATIYKHGLQPDARTLNTLLHGLFMQGSMVGKTSDALELLNKIHDSKWIKPYVYCFSPIVDSLCKQGRIDESLSLIHDMINYGVAPDVVTHTSLVHGLCESGRWKEAKNFLIGMLHSGISPNICTYSAPIDTLCKERRIQEAESLLGMMTKKGLQPNEGRTKEALDLIEAMTGRGVTPNIITYNSLRYDRHVRPNIVTYDSLLNGLCDLGQLEEVEKIFDMMVK
ncbi:Pentatricopeptide repeat [Parasponia andersonii]|uniref:Pentatricopeptide repeat n=1 Tax=Parasponia andersonii TaxID=3476 RepID=A0A2P5BWY6_PARAD|nr:Pentatricopeptide repeat [Parasponia andersonii]